MTVAPLFLRVPSCIVVVPVMIVPVAALPAVDFVQLPPGEVIVMTPRRMPVPGTETAVVPEPARHVPVPVHANVLVARLVMIVAAFVCRGRRRCCEAEAADDSECAD